MPEPNVNDLLIGAIAKNKEKGTWDYTKTEPNFADNMKSWASQMGQAGTPEPVEWTADDDEYSYINQEFEDSKAQLEQWQETWYQSQYDENYQLQRKPGVTNHLGETLPELALGWDFNGQAYYGDDWKGVWNRFRQTLRGTDRTRYTKKGQEKQDDFKSNVAEGDSVFGAPLRATGAIGQLLGDFFQKATVDPVKKEWQKVMGMKQDYARDVLGYEIPMPFMTAEEVRERGEEAYQGRGVSGFGGGENEPLTPVWKDRKDAIDSWLYGMANSVVMTLEPTTAIKTASALWKGGVVEPWLWKAENADDPKYASGRVLYSSWAHGAGVLEESSRKIAAGQDPYLVAKELEDPIAEAVGDILFDLTGVIGILGRTIRTTSRISKAESFLGISDDMVDLLRNSEKVMDKNGAIQWTADFIQGVSKLKAQRAKVGLKLEQMKKSTSIWDFTAEGRRYYHSNHMGVIFDMLLTQAKDPDEVVDGLRALYLLGGENNGDIARGMEILTHLKVPQPLLSEGGMQASYFMRKMIGNDANKFLNDMKAFQKLDDEVKAVAEMTNYINKKMDNALEAYFPTMMQRIANGEEIASHIKTAVRVQDRLKGPLGRANRFFAHVYMGYSPGYAFRNALTNTFHVATDEGVRAVTRGGFRQWVDTTPLYDEISKTLGGLVPRALSGISKKLAPGATKGLQGAEELAGGEGLSLAEKLLKDPMARLANHLEEVAAHQVVLSSVKRTMRNALKEGKAIPDMNPLYKAGLDKDTGSYLYNAVVNNHGDIRKATEEVIGKLQQGRINLFQSLDFVDPKDRQLFQDSGIWDEIVQMASGEYTNKADAKAKIALWAKEILSDGDAVKKEGMIDEASPFMDDVAIMGEAREMGIIEDDDIRIITSYFGATNQFFNDSTNAATDAWKLTMNDPEALAIWDEVLPNGQRAKEFLMAPNHSAMQEELAELGHLTGEWSRRVGNKRMMAEAELAEAWVELQLPGAPPVQMLGQDFKDFIWADVHRPHQRLSWQNARDEYATNFMNTMEQLIDGGHIDDLRGYEQAKRSLELSGRWDDTASQSEIIWKIRHAKSNKDAVIQVARKYNFETSTAVGSMAEGVGGQPGAMLDDKLLALVNKYNPPAAGQWQSLDDVPWESADRAFQIRMMEQSGMKTEMLLINKIKRAKPDKINKVWADLEAQDLAKFSVENNKGIYRVKNGRNGWVTIVEDNGNTMPISARREALSKLAEKREYTETAARINMNVPDAEKLVADSGETLKKGFNVKDAVPELDEAGEAIVEEGFALTGQYQKVPDDFRIPSGAETVPAPDGGVYARIKPGTRDLNELFTDNPTTAYAGGLPNMSRFVEQSDMQNAFSRLIKGIDQNYGKTKTVYANDELVKALQAWAREGEQRIGHARVIAAEVAAQARRFTLLNYPEKRGIDTALAHIFPYEFWYRGTYVNWMKRATSNPATIRNFTIYRNAMEKIHADLPPWWRQQINTSELLGMESDNPIYFNAVQQLNPMNGLLGDNFDDPKKRVNWWTRVADDASKFGPSLFTPYNYAIAVALQMQGEDEAAAHWGGRLIPQTQHLKRLLTMAGADIRYKQGVNELDLGVLWFNQGMDEWERRKVARSYNSLIAGGRATQAQAQESAWNQNDELWYDAVKLTNTQGGLWGLSSFLFGVGFKPRTKYDLEIDVMDGKYRWLLSNQDNMTEEQFREGMNNMRDQFPFMDTVLLSRKTGADRDRAYAYSVLSRLPPGYTDDIFASLGVDKKLLSKFWSDRGQMEKWGETERSRFMDAIVDIGAIADLPDDATKDTWETVRKQYNAIRGQAEQIWGEDIHEKISTFYNLSDDKDRQKRYMKQNPDVEQAMQFIDGMVNNNEMVRPYYMSIDKMYRFYNSQKWDAIYAATGVEDKDAMQVYWDGYNAAKWSGEKGAAKKYWDEHPILAQYLDVLDQYSDVMDTAFARVSLSLPEPIMMTPRADLPEELNLGQQGVFDYLEEQGKFEETQQMTWEDWTAEMPSYLVPIVEDYFMGEQEMTSNLEDALDRVSQKLDISTDVMLEYMLNSLQGETLQ